jgi:DNA-binding NtrC family response regulator
MQTNWQNGKRKLRVLVVDDYRDSADALAWLLHNIGHQVRTAYDAASALRAFDELAPEVVFQDLMLPARHVGVQIAREIRKRTPSASAVLIAMTGNRDTVLHDSERDAFDHLILKPVGLEQLHEILGKACVRAGGTAALIVGNGRRIKRL